MKDLSSSVSLKKGRRKTSCLFKLYKYYIFLYIAIYIISYADESLEADWYLRF